MPIQLTHLNLCILQSPCKGALKIKIKHKALLKHHTSVSEVDNFTYDS